MRSTTIRVLPVLVALLVGAAACKGDSAEDRPGAAASAEVRTYTVRGRVEVMPSGDQERIQIFHEEVPDFVDPKGEVDNMASMSMPFGVAEGVSLGDIEEGDPIEFTFEVDWNLPEVSRVIEIEKLPEDTDLALE